MTYATKNIEYKEEMINIINWEETINATKILKFFFNLLWRDLNSFADKLGVPSETKIKGDI